MDLVVHQVMEFEHVDHADGDLLVEGLTRPPVEKDRLAFLGKVGEFQHLPDLVFIGAVKDRGGEGDPTLQTRNESLDIPLRCLVDKNIRLRRGINCLDFLFDLLQILPCLHQFVDLVAQTFGRPTEMGLQNLANVHPGGNPQGIEDNIHRGAVHKIGHIFFRQDPGKDSLVPMAACHLVAHG